MVHDTQDRHDTTQRVISAGDASQGARPQGVIYVLGVSLVMVALAFAFIYFH